MGQNIIKKYQNCGVETYQEWQCDYDSEPEEPQFVLVCCNCGHEEQQ